MKLRIRNNLDSIKYTEFEIETEVKTPINEIIEILLERLKPKIKEIRYLIINTEGQKEITDYNKSLEDYKFKGNDSIQLEPKMRFAIDSNVMISLFYLGPPLVFTIYYLNSSKDDVIQLLAVIMTYIHYLRRIYEQLFIFQMGVEKFPLFNIALLNVFPYYWGLFGIYGGYAIFNTRYEDSSTLYVIKTFVFILLFLYAEYGNNRAHVYLANLKKNNNNQRAIPKGGMFEYVSCAHYFWEVMSWVFFACIVNTLPSYIFILTSILAMGASALEKHSSLKNYFGEKYPQNRKAILPFII